MSPIPSLSPLRVVHGAMTDHRVAVAAGTAALIVALAGASLASFLSPGAPRATLVAHATVAAHATVVPPAGSASATPSPSASPAGEIALVPIVEYWSPRRSIGRTELAALLASGDVAVATGELLRLAATLHVTPDSSVREMPASQLKAAVREDGSLVGVISAADVTPDVRALAIDGVSLFGAERIHDFEAWPLLVPATSPDGFDETSVWTLAAGGDVMLDRAIYRQTVLQHKGADFPWDGGTALIAGHRPGPTGAQIAIGRRTGNAGAIRALLRDADLSAVNLEGPVSDRFTFHPDGLVFTFDPALLAGLSNAGIDVAGLANNHIVNAGTAGVVETCDNLDAAGIEHAGAGANLAAARAPVWEKRNGTRIAVLAYDAIRPGYWASASRPGTAGLRIGDVVADIRAVRAAGAEVVVVMPHWGIEYSDALRSIQRSEAQAMADAGADVILGSHSHWPGGMASLAGAHGQTLVFWSLGDLVFDIDLNERTQEGLIADLTFSGSRLIQAVVHPTLILDAAQPNLLDPAGDGKKVLADVRRASKGLGW